MLDLFNNKMASFFFFYSVSKVVQQRTSVRGELEGQSLPSHIFSGWRSWLLLFSSSSFSMFRPCLFLQNYLTETNGDKYLDFDTLQSPLINKQEWGLDLTVKTTDKNVFSYQTAKCQPPPPAAAPQNTSAGADNILVPVNTATTSFFKALMILWCYLLTTFAVVVRWSVGQLVSFIFSVSCLSWCRRRTELSLHDFIHR